MIDYDVIGGCGIQVDDDMVLQLAADGLFTLAEWDRNPDDCLGRTGFHFAADVGNHYSGEDLKHYIFIEGYDLLTVNAKAAQFLEKLRGFGINKTMSDLKLICDIDIA